MDGDGIAARYLCAQALAREAGRLARDMRAAAAGLQVEEKGRQDLVTAADRAAEALLRQRLSASFPSDAFLGEEEGASGDIEAADIVWVIDPIDGTANFVRGLSFWCVSIGMLARGVPEIGIIYDPNLDELYAARRGFGATRDGAPIRVSPQDALDRATIGLGFTFRRPAASHADLVRRLLEAGVEYRRFGSGALSLAHVADGRLEGFATAHTNAWDVLAGIVLVREAGGWTSDFLAGEGLRRGNGIVATTPTLRDGLLDIVGDDLFSPQTPVP